MNMCEIAVKDAFPEDLPIHVKDFEVVNGKTIPTYFLMK